ncbi:MAG: type II toxin-antitoxin system HicB family antitoxin [Deltaproteobacteria bacterium]|nr:type II toxin-antitoxin system HicB family antitoxin [Deltaproteobacteria bacterium]
MQYPIVIHKDSKSDYGVTVPDLPGCFSAGSSFEEALSMAQEAIECHAEGLLEAGELLPLPHSIELHQKKTKYRGGVWAMVSVDLSKLLKKAKRINITFPERLLHQVDDYASRQGETRSGLLAKAAMEYLTSHQ